MFLLWIVKLYWIWIILGLIILIPSVLPPGISILWTVIGGALTLLGLVFRKAMQSDQLKQRIDRNL